EGQMGLLGPALFWQVCARTEGGCQLDQARFSPTKVWVIAVVPLLGKRVRFTSPLPRAGFRCLRCWEPPARPATRQRRRARRACVSMIPPVGGKVLLTPRIFAPCADCQAAPPTNSAVLALRAANSAVMTRRPASLTR